MSNQNQKARTRAAEDDTDTETNLILSTPPPPFSLVDSLLHAGSIQKVRKQQKSYSQKYKDRVEAYDSERLFLRFGFHRISRLEREWMTVIHLRASSNTYLLVSENQIAHNTGKGALNIREEGQVNVDVAQCLRSSVCVGDKSRNSLK